MDLCRLKNREFESQFQKYKGRVVLRRDIVKDDSGANAVFTEQGSSVSQMTAAKVMDVILLDNPIVTDKQLTQYRRTPRLKMDDAQKLFKNSQIRMSGCMDTSSKT